MRDIHLSLLIITCLASVNGYINGVTTEKYLIGEDSTNIHTVGPQANYVEKRQKFTNTGKATTWTVSLDETTSVYETGNHSEAQKFKSNTGSITLKNGDSKIYYVTPNDNQIVVEMKPVEEEEVNDKPNDMDKITMELLESDNKTVSTFNFQFQYGGGNVLPFISYGGGDPNPTIMSDNYVKYTMDNNKITYKDSKNLPKTINFIPPNSTMKNTNNAKVWKMRLTCKSKKTDYEVRFPKNTAMSESDYNKEVEAAKTKKGGIETKIIVGIVLGAVCVLGALGGIGYLIYRCVQKRRKKQSRE